MCLIPVYDAIAAIDDNADWSDPHVILETIGTIGMVTEPYTYYQALPKEGRDAIEYYLTHISEYMTAIITIESGDGSKTIISDNKTTIIE